MLVKINESMAEDKFKDPTINKDAALWNDTRPHYNVGHVVPERDIKFEIIKGHEDHGPQPILVWNGKRLRPRAEMIVFNSKTGEILIRDNPSYKNSNVPFELPGGGLMEGKSFLETAIIEVKQEVRMNVRDAWDSHIYYINQSPDGTEQEWTTWGDYSQICCGICDGIYAGEIDDQDKDEDMARDAKWVRIEEVNLTPAHEEAIREYKRFLYSRGNSGFQVVKESVIDIDKIRTFEDMQGKKMDPLLLQRFINSIPIRFEETDGYRKFRWPEDVFYDKKANCTEMSFLLKYYFDTLNRYYVEYVPVIVSLMDIREDIPEGKRGYVSHMLIFSKSENMWWVHNMIKYGFFSTKLGKDKDRSISEYLEMLFKALRYDLDDVQNTNSVNIKVILSKADLDMIDQYYGQLMNQIRLLGYTSFGEQVYRQTHPRYLLMGKTTKSDYMFIERGSDIVNKAVMKLHRRYHK